MPTTRLGRIAVGLILAFFGLWLGNYALEAWARMPISTLSTKLMVMITYAYVTVAVGIISGIIAIVAKFHFRDTSLVLWVPMCVLLVLVGAVVRSLLFP